MNIAHIVFIVSISLACIALDRLRGDRRGSGGFVESFVYGFMLAWVAGNEDSATFLCLYGIGFAVGESWGWGPTLGAILEKNPMHPSKLKWWQVGPLATSPWLSAVARGLMWGAAPYALTGFDPRSLAPSLAISTAFVLSLVIARHFTAAPVSIGGEVWADSRWTKMEMLRGGLAALLAAFYATAL